MKKIIAVFVVLFTVAFVFSACDTQRKCAAYGHYSYNMPVETHNGTE